MDLTSSIFNDGMVSLSMFVSVKLFPIKTSAMELWSSNEPSPKHILAMNSDSVVSGSECFMCFLSKTRLLVDLNTHQFIAKQKTMLALKEF